MRCLVPIALASCFVLGCERRPDVPDCSDDQDSQVCGVYQIVNRERIDAGLPAYDYDTDLAVAAQLHAEDMAANDYFDHTSQDGRSFSERAKEAGYDASPRGENIAWGQPTPEAVMESWMNSSGHRANILAEGSTEMGVGFAEDHWVQVFGTRSAQ